MTPEQTEKLLLTLAEKFEEATKQFVVGLSSENFTKNRKWFTPKELTLRALRAGAAVTPGEIQIALGALHGCIDLFGFAGTLRLAMQLKRRYDDGRRGQKKA